MPSSTPSESPSISVAPSIEPTIQPSVSTGPTGQPSLSPSTSQRPSRLPSVSPSVSLAPTFTTEWPSESPTSTHAPSESPTFGPSVSQMPSVSPTYVPTGKPSIAPSTSQLPTCGGNDIDCGYGFWNIWTCQCDCAPGYCLSANQKCYDGCTTRTAFNPFGGCIPGTDCPWYPEPSGKTYCVTTVNVAGQYNLHRIAEHCCEKHFSYLNINTCVSESEQSVEVAKETIAATKERPMYYYPDVYGRDNCIYWNGYYNWMEAEGYSDSYLFDSATDCCSMWYPGRTNCPDLAQPTDRDINENPYPVKGYFYPHFDESNCRFGRNYPMYMGQELYVQHYLFTTPDECCSKFFPTAGESCPLGPDDGVQQGRYWKVDVYFYPDWDGRGDYCIVGDAYPEWMADPIHKPTHLFMTATDCCEKWFSDEVSECEASIVAVDKEDDEEKPKKDWYPTLVYPFECLSDGNIPSWMLQTGYKAYYVFKSKAACCKAYYCSN